MTETMTETMTEMEIGNKEETNEITGVGINSETNNEELYNTEVGNNSDQTDNQGKITYMKIMNNTMNNTTMTYP